MSVVETPQEPHYIGQCPEKWLYFGHKVQMLTQTKFVLMQKTLPDK